MWGFWLLCTFAANDVSGDQLNHRHRRNVKLKMNSVTHRTTSVTHAGLIVSEFVCESEVLMRTAMVVVVATMLIECLLIIVQGGWY